VCRKKKLRVFRLKATEFTGAEVLKKPQFKELQMDAVLKSMSL